LSKECLPRKRLDIDFEFHDKAHPEPIPYCAAWLDDGTPGKIWLKDQKENTEWLKNFLIERKSTHYIISYGIEAEAKCILSMTGLSVTDFTWVDLYLEYRQILNEDYNLMYGKQLIRGKKKVTKPKPLKYQRTEEDDFNPVYDTPQFSLAAALYKLLDIEIDLAHKAAMRQICIDGRDPSPKEREDILEYCMSDVIYLPKLHEQIKLKLKSHFAVNDLLSLDQVRKGVLERGEYAARTAVMYMKGYPIDVSSLRQFSDAVPEILWEFQERVNNEHPEVSPFQFNKKTGKYIQKRDRILDWVRAQNFPKWLLTDGGQLSPGVKAFERYFKPESQGFGGSFVTYLHSKMSLNGFMPPKEGAKSFWDHVGPDGRVRPYFNIYGAQTSRSQPRATGYIPLKSRWMRSHIVPPKGYVLISIDYGSQEIFIGALLSGDRNMIEAYRSGDVYLAFAKSTGAVPQDGSRDNDEHERQRNYHKSAVLGIQYGMASKSLSVKLTGDTGKVFTEKEAQVYIDKFDETYSTFKSWYNANITRYKRFGRLNLPCGWFIWGDNPNWRSSGNFPIQGFGASVMRKAVALSQDRGVDIVYTLHDALTAEIKMGDWEKIDILADSMRKAFSFYFEDGATKILAEEIKLDINVWSQEFSKGQKISTRNFPEINTEQIYIHKNAIKDFNYFKKFFNFSCLDDQ